VWLRRSRISLFLPLLFFRFSRIHPFAHQPVYPRPFLSSSSFMLPLSIKFKTWSRVCIWAPRPTTAFDLLPLPSCRFLKFFFRRVVFQYEDPVFGVISVSSFSSPHAGPSKPDPADPVLARPNLDPSQVTTLGLIYLSPPLSLFVHHAFSSAPSTEERPTMLPTRRVD